MFALEILDVAIGLIFVWLVLSLATMSVQEWIAGLFKFRSKDLEKQIRHILNDPPPKWLEREQWFNQSIKELIDWIRKRFGRTEIDAAPTKSFQIADEFYNHPLIQALSKKGKKPSYIPARIFSRALFDVVMTAGTDESVIQKGIKKWEKKLDALNLKAEVLAAVESELLKLQDTAKEHAKKPEFKAKVTAEIERIVNSLGIEHPNPGLKWILGQLLEDVLPPVIDAGASELLAGANKLWDDNPQVAQALSSLIADIKEKADELEDKLASSRKNVENWFNDSMARLGGEYKRRAQWIGALIGLLMAIAFNVDSISIGAMLWREPLVREALVKQAETFEMPDIKVADETTEPGEAGKSPEEAWNQFYENFDGMDLPFGWENMGSTCYKTDDPPSFWIYNTAKVQFPKKCVVPIGNPAFPPAGYFWTKFFGWLISGVAASQGATHWFDILKLLINIRSSGKNPVEDKEKKEK